MKEENKELKGSIQKAKDLMEEGIGLYNDSSVLRLSIIGIPVIGTVIDTIITTEGQKISYKRLLDFYNQLSNEVSLINDRVIDLEFVKSEEFYDLLLKMSEASMKTRNEEKRKLYSKILATACSNKEIKTDPEHFFNVIAELSVEELLVAKKLFDLKTSEDYNRIVKENYREGSGSVKTSLVLSLTELEIPKEDYEFILLRLQKVGLIKEVVGSFMGYTGGSYELTETFKKLMQVLK